MQLETAWNGGESHFGNSNDGNDIETCAEEFK